MRIPTPVRNHPVVTGLSVLIVTPIVVLVAWTTLSLHLSYSSGDRSGYLQKLSKRGWLCKTWEGEMLSAAQPGLAPEKFLFSVRSDSIAALLNKLNGQHIVVSYEQHTGVPTKCFGDTEYFAVGARAVGQE